MQKKNLIRLKKNVKTKSKLNDEKIERTKSVQSLKPGHGGGFKHYTSCSERPKFRNRPAELGENLKSNANIMSFCNCCSEEVISKLLEKENKLATSYSEG